MDKRIPAAGYPRRFNDIGGILKETGSIDVTEEGILREIRRRLSDIVPARPYELPGTVVAVAMIGYKLLDALGTPVC